MLLIDIILFVFGLLLLAASSHVLVDTLEVVTTKLRISQFKFSMILLGILTSLPELSIGMNAALEGKPDIYIGNLLGGIVVMFLWIIPFLAIFGKGIKIDKGIKGNDLMWSMLIILLPVIMIIDHHYSLYEALILVFAYLIKILLTKTRRSVNVKTPTNYKFMASGVIISILLIATLFMASRVIVDRSISIADQLNIPTFIIGLFILTIGTNLPEFTIAVNAVKSGRKEIAFGDHIGSALSNVFIFGLCGLISGGAVINFDTYRLTSFFLLMAVALFYLFIRSRNEITQKEGFVLISFFLVFAIVQILIK